MSCDLPDNAHFPVSYNHSFQDAIATVRTSYSAPSFEIAPSLRRPGGNVTGVTQLTGEVAPKRVELAHELVPQATAPKQAEVSLHRSMDPCANTRARRQTEPQRLNHLSMRKRQVLGPTGIILSPFHKTRAFT